MYFNDVKDVRRTYGSSLWTEYLSNLPSTYTIFGQYEISRAEEELFMRKLKDANVYTKSFMNEGVGHDVENWLCVQFVTPAHIKEVDYIKAGFESKN